VGSGDPGDGAMARRRFLEQADLGSGAGGAA
jgi:hypothetical protein